MAKEPTYTYDAFISYRRSDGSSAAERLRQRLRAYRLPKSLAAAPRAMSIYLDRIYERGTIDFFEETIVPALKASRYLIVVVTPDACADKGDDDWIVKEIDLFLTLPQRNNVMVVVAKGDLATPLPASLGSRFPQIQRIDLRGLHKPRWRQPVSLRRRLAHGCLEVIAPLFDISPESMPQLRREDESRRRKQRTYVGATTGIVATAIAALSYATYRSNQAEKENRQLAVEVATAMISANPDELGMGFGPEARELMDLSCRRLEEIPGASGNRTVRWGRSLCTIRTAEEAATNSRRSDALRQYARACQLLDALLNEKEDLSIRVELAHTLIAFGNEKFAQRQATNGTVEFARANALLEEVADLEDARVSGNRSLVLRSRSDVSKRDGDLPSALALSEEALRFAKLAVKQASSPTPPIYLANEHAARAAIGDIFEQMGDFDRAEGMYTEAFRGREQLLSDHPHRADFREHVAWSHGELGSLAEERGQWALSLDHYKRAAEIYENVARRESDNHASMESWGDSVEHVGRLSFKHEDYEASRRAFGLVSTIREELSLADPTRYEYRHDSYRAEHLLGLTAFSQRDLQLAEEKFLKSLALISEITSDFETTPSLLDDTLNSRLALATLYRVQGVDDAFEQQALAAQAAIDQLAASPDPESQGYVATKRPLLDQLNRDESWTDVLTYFLGEDETPEDSAEWFLGLAYESDNPMGKRELLERSLQLDPQQPEAHLELGWLEYEAGRLDVAADHFTTTLRSRPDWGLALNNLGLVRQDQDRSDDALELWHRVLRKPDAADAHSFAHQNIAEWHLGRGENDPAIEAFRQSVAASPARAWAHFSLGYGLYKAEKCERAISAYREALRLDETMALAWNNLGLCLRETGDADGALACWQRALEEHDDGDAHAYARANLGEYYESVGDPARARDHYEQSFLANPELDQALFDIGRMSIELRDFARAEEALRQLIERHPKAPWPHFLLGRTLSSTNRSDAATAAFREAARLGPDDEDLQQALRDYRIDDNAP